MPNFGSFHSPPLIRWREREVHNMKIQHSVKMLRLATSIAWRTPNMPAFSWSSFSDCRLKFLILLLSHHTYFYRLFPYFTLFGWNYKWDIWLNYILFLCVITTLSVMILQCIFHPAPYIDFVSRCSFVCLHFLVPDLRERLI